MDKGAHPSMYVVDSHATRPPVPPRLSQVRRHAGVAQTLLFLLVSVALCGITIEACLIYRLYHTKSATSASSSKVVGEQADTPAIRPGGYILPSKPVAHLTDGNDVVQAGRIMAWSTDANPLLYEMDYKNKSLVIQKEGYYYVYSKVFFSDSGVFYHLVDYRTEGYGKSINLLQSRKYSSERETIQKSNSYLGGVFHLNKNDAIFVRVSDASKIRRHKSSENFFGAYMI